MGKELTPNAFIGMAAAPSAGELGAALGAALPVWEKTLAMLSETFGLTEQEWHSYSAKSGWSLRVRKAKRNILYMSPCRDCFRVAFVLGPKAVSTARAGKAPARVLKLIDAGEQYPEGLGIRWEVNSARDVPAIEALTAIKLAH